MQWFHTHIYYSSPEERIKAVELQEQLAARKFKTLQISRLVDRAIGPHPVPMFEADFALEEFTAVVTWLMYNRNGLSILLHPVTEPEKENHLKDHTLRAMWFGKSLELNLAIFD